ncbi:MAG TPA: TPM domain-containing protein [Rhodocyclaceae bacterium]|nr:TPM domain-containing protein [Rhodocyclaceae bacterium]
MAEKDGTPRGAGRKRAARPADAAASAKPLARRIREAPPGSPLVWRIRLAALGLLILVLALIFAVPQRPEAARAPDHPDEAFVDRAGLVSKQYAWETGGVLLRDPRFQMVVYVDAAPPDGGLSGWTNGRASAWRIGAQEDNGIVLFVFRDARIARAEVGYGLEDRLPDALVRRLLEDRLAPRFAAGDFEGGFDAFIKGVGEALGGDEAMHKLWQELGSKPRKSTTAMLLDTYSEGIERAPRMVAATWRTYIEGGATERIFVLICVGIFLAILAATVAVAVVTVSIAVKLARGRPDAAAALSGADAFGGSPRARLAAGAFGLVFGTLTVALFSMILLFALSLIGEQMHRKGDFSGAGAQVVWAAPR